MKVETRTRACVCVGGDDMMRCMVRNNFGKYKEIEKFEFKQLSFQPPKTS